MIGTRMQHEKRYGLPVVVCGDCGTIMGDARGYSAEYHRVRGCLVCWRKTHRWNDPVWAGPEVDGAEVWVMP